MKKIILAISVLLFFNSCATLFCKQTYVAQIKVLNSKSPLIYIGISENTIKNNEVIKIKRKDIANVSFRVIDKENNCKGQVFIFKERRARIGPILLNCTFTAYGLGILIDALSGAMYMPSTKESGIEKVDNNYYIYNLNYTGCADKKE